MSRVGKVPITTGSGVEVAISPQNEVSVKSGSKKAVVKVHPSIQVSFKDGQIVLTRKNNTQAFRAWHGLYRALIYNAVVGVSKGWKKTLLYKGVGYKAQVSGRTLEMNLGFSHPIKLNIPEGIEVKTGKNNLELSGVSKEQVGQFSAQIRDLRPPEPYLGKGVRYQEEQIRKKAGKSGASASGGK